MFQFVMTCLSETRTRIVLLMAALLLSLGAFAALNPADSYTSVSLDAGSPSPVTVAFLGSNNPPPSGDPDSGG